MDCTDQSQQAFDESNARRFNVDDMDVVTRCDIEPFTAHGRAENLDYSLQPPCQLPLLFCVVLLVIVWPHQVRRVLIIWMMIAARWHPQHPQQVCCILSPPSMSQLGPAVVGCLQGHDAGICKGGQQQQQQRRRNDGQARQHAGCAMHMTCT